MRRTSKRIPAAFLLLGGLAAQTIEPRTVPEATAYAETSRAADVQRFVDACVGLSHGDRLTVRVAGKSEQGRAMLAVKVALPTPPAADAPARLRALVIADIHAGEVEGKEAVQVLLREFASGQHEALLRGMELWFVPIYNVDGNEAVKLGNRRGQNGPDVVGTRHNANELDLNRDFVKADAKETRVLLSLWNELDPHLFVDLHTTNGSFHGYQLTYAPSLSANLDRGVDRLGRELLAATRAALRPQGFETFDYGNFETHDWDGSGAPDSGSERGWFTYDHRARYGVNGFALRNRVAILSEAYSYADFETRIAATRAFVLTLCEQLLQRRDEALAVMARAERRLADGDAWFGWQTTFGDPEPLPVLVGEAEEVKGEGDRPTRIVQQPGAHEETMPVFRRFRAHAQRRLPEAWAIVGPSPEVVQRLQWHGVQFRAVEAPTRRRVERFAVDKKKKPKRPYQGHQELVLEGHWEPAYETELPLGTIVIDAHQPHALVAATLLEPESEDSLSSWNFFEAATDELYPVLRVVR
ncbi:MAG: hypothetical protein H6835_06905 [Planctomycetes bacterium]|nr:hypothetical protein [Planctomycetota bacterium]